MDEPQLRAALKRLHQELSSARSLDEGTRDVLRGLIADIQPLLEEAGEDSAPRYHSLRERLTDSLHHFDASHPRLATAIANTLDSLALLGL